MGIIPNSKQGDCSLCSSENVQCRKRGKDLICLNCCKAIDTKKQITKANDRNKVRGLINYQRQEGMLDGIGELKLDLDRVSSRYIRLRDMESDGKITCYCCGKRVAWQKAHCMHFIDRVHMATRYLIANLHSGCFECNVEKRGNLEAYAEHLEKETPDIVYWLQEQSRTVANVTQSELKELLYDFHQKIRLVETKLTIQNENNKLS